MTIINEKNLEYSASLTSAYHNYEKSLCMHAFYKVHNREICADLVQETFLKTWIYLIKGKQIILMRAFLYHVLNNLIIDEYRKRKNMSLDELLEKGYEPSALGDERIVDYLDGARAMDLIKSLPENYRKVMYMKYSQELSLEELSTITGKNKNSQAVQLHRGLEKLKLLYLNSKVLI